MYADNIIIFNQGDEDDDQEDEDEDDSNQQAKRRVVGVLLGSVANDRLDITSSFAVPFEEDPSDASIWFFDHAYAEQMYRMHSRIHAKEKVVGWYSTGPKIRENDLDIGELFEKYCADPVLVIVNLSPTADDAPTEDKPELTAGDTAAAPRGGQRARINVTTGVITAASGAAFDQADDVPANMPSAAMDMTYV